MSDALMVGLLAAGAAIIGYIVTNLVVYKNTGRQLKHDREVKAAERELTLRKEVYLGLAENLYGGISMLGFMVDPNLTMQQVTADWRTSNHFQGKVHLMAGSELVAAAAEANFAIAQGLMNLAPLRGRLEVVKEKQAFLQKLIDARHAGSEGAFAYLQQKQMAGQDTKQDAERILSVGRMQAESAAELSAKQDALSLEQASIQRAMLSMVLTSQVDLLRKLVPVIKAARAELKVDFDEAAYAQLIRRSEEHSKVMVRTVLGERAAA